MSISMDTYEKKRTSVSKLVGRAIAYSIHGGRLLFIKATTENHNSYGFTDSELIELNKFSSQRLLDEVWKNEDDEFWASL